MAAVEDKKPQRARSGSSRSARPRRRPEPVAVQAARIPDRDRLLETLLEGGLDAEPNGEVGIAVHCPGGTVEEDAVEAYVQDTIEDLAGIFVPIRHEGVIYVRPPVA